MKSEFKTETLRKMRQCGKCSTPSQSSAT